MSNPHCNATQRNPATLSCHLRVTASPAAPNCRLPDLLTDLQHRTRWKSDRYLPYVNFVRQRGGKTLLDLISITKCPQLTRPNLASFPSPAKRLTASVPRLLGPSESQQAIVGSISWHPFLPSRQSSQPPHVVSSAFLETTRVEVLMKQ